jgi:hypothetical protein
MSPVAAAEASTSDTVREIGDMSHLSAHDHKLTSPFAHVTIVICVTVVTSEQLIGIHP